MGLSLVPMSAYSSPDSNYQVNPCDFFLDVGDLNLTSSLGPTCSGAIPRPESLFLYLKEEQALIWDKISKIERELTLCRVQSTNLPKRRLNTTLIGINCNSILAGGE